MVCLICSGKQAGRKEKRRAATSGSYTAVFALLTLLKMLLRSDDS
jgi:hypothetical protein